MIVGQSEDVEFWDKHVMMEVNWEGANGGVCGE